MAWILQTEGNRRGGEKMPIQKQTTGQIIKLNVENKSNENVQLMVNEQGCKQTNEKKRDD